MAFWFTAIKLLVVFWKSWDSFDGSVFEHHG